MHVEFSGVHGIEALDVKLACVLNAMNNSKANQSWLGNKQAGSLHYFSKRDRMIVHQHMQN
jgi:hypothetical protein